jgi:hypothetical protein
MSYFTASRAIVAAVLLFALAVAIALPAPV